MEANMKDQKQFCPRLESLEMRLPLSAVPVYPNTLHLALDGQLSGTWSNLPPIPDAGKTQILSGSGHIEHLGHVQVSGHLTSPGMIAAGRTTGEVTITDHHGSITFRLVGAQTQPGFSDPTNKYYFAIEGGTGIYSHIWGGGVAILQEQSGGHPNWQPGLPHPDFVFAPVFALTLQAYK
jgi:hypothetical protein